MALKRRKSFLPKAPEITRRRKAKFKKSLDPYADAATTWQSVLHDHFKQGKDVDLGYIYTGMVMRVEEPWTKESADLNLATDTPHGRWLRNIRFNKSLPRIKVFIPDLHGQVFPHPNCLPNRDQPNKNHGIIDLYPTFTAKFPHLTTPLPGQIVEVQFDSRSDFDAGVYTAVLDDKFIDHKLAFSCEDEELECPHKLQANAPAGDPTAIEGTSSEIYHTGAQHLSVSPMGLSIPTIPLVTPEESETVEFSEDNIPIIEGQADYEPQPDLNGTEQSEMDDTETLVVSHNDALEANLSTNQASIDAAAQSCEDAEDASELVDQNQQTVEQNLTPSNRTDIENNNPEAFRTISDLETLQAQIIPIQNEIQALSNQTETKKVAILGLDAGASPVNDPASVDAALALMQGWANTANLRTSDAQTVATEADTVLANSSAAGDITVMAVHNVIVNANTACQSHNNSITTQISAVQAHKGQLDLQADQIEAQRQERLSQHGAIRYLKTNEKTGLKPRMTPPDGDRYSRYVPRRSRIRIDGNIFKRSPSADRTWWRCTYVQKVGAQGQLSDPVEMEEVNFWIRGDFLVTSMPPEKTPPVPPAVATNPPAPVTPAQQPSGPTECQTPACKQAGEARRAARQASAAKRPSNTGAYLECNGIRQPIEWPKDKVVHIWKEDYGPAGDDDAIGLEECKRRWPSGEAWREYLADHFAKDKSESFNRQGSPYRKVGTGPIHRGGKHHSKDAVGTTLGPPIEGTPRVFTVHWPVSSVKWGADSTTSGWAAKWRKGDTGFATNFCIDHDGTIMQVWDTQFGAPGNHELAHDDLGVEVESSVHASGRHRWEDYEKGLRSEGGGRGARIGWRVHKNDSWKYPRGKIMIPGGKNADYKYQIQKVGSSKWRHGSEMCETRKEDDMYVLYTNEQIQALEALMAAVSEAHPIPLVTPTRPDGTQLNAYNITQIDAKGGYRDKKGFEAGTKIDGSDGNSPFEKAAGGVVHHYQVRNGGKSDAMGLDLVPIVANAAKIKAARARNAGLIEGYEELGGNAALREAERKAASDNPCEGWYDTRNEGRIAECEELKSLRAGAALTMGRPGSSSGGGRGSQGGSNQPEEGILD